MVDSAKNATAFILRLPSELLYEIIRQAMPESFESLLLTCQTLYTSGQHLIPLYRERKRIWSTFAADRTDRRGLLVCLNRIAQDPEVLRFVITAKLDLVAPKACPTTPEYIDSPAYREYAQIRASTDAIDHVRSFIEQSQALRQPGLDAQAWSTGILDPILNISEDECDCSFDSKRSQIFLISLLKNVQTLRLEVDQYHTLHGAESDFLLMLSSIKSRQALQPLDAPLAQLHALLSFPPLGFTSWRHFASLGFFLTSPHLAKLCATSYLAVQDRYNTIFNWPASMPSHPHLRTIELLDCCFDEHGLEPLVAGTPNLESFRFGYAIKHQGRGNDFNPATFVRVLGKYVGKSLKHLSLAIEQNFYGAIQNGIVSMKEFLALESLEADFRYFYGPSIESGEVNGAYAVLPPNGTPFWTAAAIPPLKESMPPTLERLELFLGESIVAGNGQRYDQDASLCALFGLSKDATGSEMAATGLGDEMPTFMSDCTVRCVSHTLSMPTTRLGRRIETLKSDLLKERLEVMGVVCHLNNTDDQEWVREFKRTYEIKSGW